MIQTDALFKVSYGLYIVSSGDSSAGNAFICNSVFQVTAKPAQFAACCNKDNHTAEIIKKYKAFAISVLHQNAKAEIIGRFGYKSGRDTNKLQGMDIRYGTSGVPFILNESVAIIECRLVQTFDAGTHLIFIGEVLNAELLSDELTPMTYEYYRTVRKGVAPANAPTYIDKQASSDNKQNVWKKYKCPACGYIYDEEKGDEANGIKAGTKFENLPAGWVCPVCGTPKDDFYEI
jgi:flavin reductase (DIM6/NTAB) family NADH-FMN oxidoreductase RutF/rubredoxin